MLNCHKNIWKFYDLPKVLIFYLWKINSYKMKTPLNVKISNSALFRAPFLRKKNIIVVLAIESHEFNKNKWKLEKKSNYDEFANQKLPRLLKCKMLTMSYKVYSFTSKENIGVFLFALVIKFARKSEEHV